jgi:hypothetical protein
MQTTPCIEDRRQSVRIMLKAYGFTHRCELQRSSQLAPVELIDVSSGGARLRIADHLTQEPLAMFEQCQINLNLQTVGVSLGFISCEVRWLMEMEFGVKFAAPLGLSIGELQRLLER